MNYEIKEEEQKFTLICKGKEVAFIMYGKDEDGTLIISTIFVKEEYRGEGYAKIIFNEFIKKAEKENRKIIPICAYAKAQFQKRQEIQKFLKS